MKVLGGVTLQLTRAQWIGLLLGSSICSIDGRGAVAASTSIDDYTTSKGLDAAPVTPSMVKLPSGVRYADLKLGTGAEVKLGSRVTMQWVLRRSNGYFVDSSQAQNFDPFVFEVGSGAAIAGLDEGIRGVRQGGVRRLVIPIASGFTTPLDRSGGPVPNGFGPRRQIERELQKIDPYNYFFLECEVTRVR